MATPRIYLKIQTKLLRFRKVFFFGTWVFAVISTVCLFILPKNEIVKDDELFVFYTCFISFNLAIWSVVLGSICGYQKEPYISKVPFVSRLYILFASKQTPWGEAMSINFTVFFATTAGYFLYLMLANGSQ